MASAPRSPDPRSGGAVRAALRAGLRPVFGLGEISVITGLQNLRAEDVVLALAQFGLASPRILPALMVLGWLAMAGVFLTALHVVIEKGGGGGRLETGWGLVLFAGCVLAPLALPALPALTERQLKAR